ncbi:hypothetical protein BKA69DRAFT_1127557 [Paraphysoderma sedebokerense]|nr:hypothetical protein BKA69DRAFT_1127557 [Paraphysoderma sedebokerense]
MLLRHILPRCKIRSLVGYAILALPNFALCLLPCRTSVQQWCVQYNETRYVGPDILYDLEGRFEGPIANRGNLNAGGNKNVPSGNESFYGTVPPLLKSAGAIPSSLSSPHPSTTRTIRRRSPVRPPQLPAKAASTPSTTSAPPPGQTPTANTDQYTYSTQITFQRYNLLDVISQQRACVKTNSRGEGYCEDFSLTDNRNLNEGTLELTFGGETRTGKFKIEQDGLFKRGFCSCV